MSRSTWASAILGTACLALLSLGGCSGAGPEASVPPPMASTPSPPASPDLQAGPPAPPVVTERAFTPMAPVANPEAMSAEERHRVYGDRYDHPRHARLARAGHHAGRETTLLHAKAALAKAGQPPQPNLPAKTALATPPARPPVSARPSAPGPQLRLPRANWLAGPRPVMLDLPGIGRVTSNRLSAVGLPLLALILVAVAAAAGLSAGHRRREARNAGRANEPRHDPSPPHPEPFEDVRFDDRRFDDSVAPFPGHADEGVMGVREHEPV